MPLKNLNYPQLVQIKRDLNGSDQLAIITAARILLNEFVDEIMDEARARHEEDQKNAADETLAAQHAANEEAAAAGQPLPYPAIGEKVEAPSGRAAARASRRAQTEEVA